MSRNICEDQKGRSIWLPSVCGMPCLGEDFRLLVAGNERKRERRSCRGDKRFLTHLRFVVVLFVGLPNFVRLQTTNGRGLIPGSLTDFCTL